VLALALTVVSTGSASDAAVKSRARAAGVTYRRDLVAISRAVPRLKVNAPATGMFAVNAGLTLKTDMRIQRALLASTSASTANGRAGRSLVLQGLTSLAACGDYLMRFGLAVEDNAPASVWQADSNGYVAKRREGESLARNGAALLGLSFG
jgi:hypothetical protein